MAPYNPIPVTDVLKILWIGSCTVFEWKNVVNPETHQTTQKLEPVFENQPCRLSYVSEYPTSTNNANLAVVQQKPKLFIAPDLKIKAGCVIEITQHGRTNRYKRSSEPAVYTNHQEIELELDEDV